MLLHATHLPCVCLNIFFALILADFSSLIVLASLALPDIIVNFVVSIINLPYTTPYLTISIFIFCTYYYWLVTFLCNTVYHIHNNYTYTLVLLSSQFVMENIFFLNGSNNHQRHNWNVCFLAAKHCNSNKLCHYKKPSHSSFGVEVYDPLQSIPM